MRKITKKERIRDVLRNLSNRLNVPVATRNGGRELAPELESYWRAHNRWIEEEMNKGLNVEPIKVHGRKKRGMLSIVLPNRMDFYQNYDQSIRTLTAIRKCTDLFTKFNGKKIPSRAFKIGRVKFDNLRSISTSSALVLTAEISRWNATIKNKLIPMTSTWDGEILKQFTQLGFFDLFKNKPAEVCNIGGFKTSLNFVKYIKGSCIDPEDAKLKKKELKREIVSLVGDDITKWTILHSGISEAVTNVTHHAYPSDDSVVNDKSWYLTGSFNRITNEMKIAFYDQGIGIPNSLPTSTVWEKAVAYFGSLNIPLADRKLDEVLLKAAMSIDRTSTGKSDRGKGLQDLVEFIKERGEGYISVISYKGLYKFQIKNGLESVKTASFGMPLCGTLIIWSVTLNP